MSVQFIRMRDRIAGTLGALSALAAAELVAGLIPSVPSLVEGVGGFVIDIVPPAVKDLAIGIFGTADKPALLVGIIVVAAALGGLVVGPLARRSSRGSAAVFAAFGVLGALAAARDPGVGLLGPLVAGLAAAGTGWWVTARLLDRAAEQPADEGRRAFLRAASAVAVLGVASAAIGRNLMERTKRVLAGRGDVVLPDPVSAAPPVPPEASLAVPGVSPVITPNAEFYRIDTALSVPQVDIAQWTLRIDGIVEEPLEITFAELLDMPMVERHITISCVSNRVGGDLVGTATWTGVPLRELLDRVRPGPGAEQVVGRSVDDFTVGFPLEAVYDGREALVAVGMNGEPLPFEHGFPARLVVAGLYGYVSATKWLSSIELRTWDGFDAYWIPRGWAKEAPIKTQSRIDTPRHNARIAPVRRAIAGVAWAPTRGISKVEVQVDDGPWLEAVLSEPLSDDTWRQWMLEWDPVPGTHVIRVRATDGDGVLQDSELRPPAPDGATGWHTI